ncbi:MAG: PEGA domain-containing protein [Ignavibacteriales bacterium]|nr:PEGA domain-containing protein [Ignavibacteriales bacterium]
MKIILKYIIVLLIIIIFPRCKDSGTSPIDPTKYYSVSGILFDVISSDYSPGVKKGAKIYLDKDSVISDNEGKFVFSKIAQGDHTLRVTLSNYEPYTKTISVSKDTSVAVYLYGIKDNYFPIKEKSQQKFKYYVGVSTSVYSWEDKGEATWIISSSKQEGNIKIYEVTERKIFTHKVYAPLNSERVDSSVSTFYINESISNIISFKSSVLDGVSFTRMLDPRLEQNGVLTLNLNSGSLTVFKVSLIKNVGITQIVKVGIGFSTTYELVQ